MRFSRQTGKVHSVSSEFRYYRSSQNKSEPTSGAYIFRPETSTTYPVVSNATETVTLVESTATELHFRLSSWVSVTYRLYPSDAFVQIEWTVGPIPIEDGYGKEVVLQLNSTIASGETFYTDANGLEYIERHRNVSSDEPVAGNYYPMTTGAYLKQDNDSLSILTDRAQGVASLASGTMEVMLHRRLLVDDNKGVRQALNETETVSDGDDEGKQRQIGLRVRGVLCVVIDEDPQEAETRRLRLAEEIFLPVLPAFRGGRRFKEHNRTLPLEAAALQPVLLPQQLRLDTFQVLSKTTRFVRLRHRYGSGEPVRLDLSILFPSHVIESYTEVSLTRNQRLHSSSTSSSPWIVTFAPMTIRTFEIQLER